MIDNDDSRVSDVEYDPDADAYVATFDPETVSANAAVIDSVAAVLHQDPLEIDPLYEYVDTDSLDALIGAAGGKASPYLEASFQFEGTDVTVSADGTVTVAPNG